MVTLITKAVHIFLSPFGASSFSTPAFLPGWLRWNPYCCGLVPNVIIKGSIGEIISGTFYLCSQQIDLKEVSTMTVPVSQMRKLRFVNISNKHLSNEGRQYCIYIILPEHTSFFLWHSRLYADLWAYYSEINGGDN